MITTKIRGRAIAKDRGWRTFFTSSYFSIIAIIALVIALLLGGVMIAMLLAGKFGHPGLYAVGGIIGLFFMAIIIILRQDEVFASRPRTLAAVHLAYGCGDVALAPLGPKWKRMRIILMANLLTIKRLESFAKHRADEAQH